MSPVVSDQIFIISQICSLPSNAKDFQYERQNISYQTVQKVEVGKIFMFLKVSSAHQGCICLVKQFRNIIPI